MKISKKIIIIVVMFLFLGVIILLSYNQSNKIKTIGKEIELDLSECKIVNESDTHEGLLGDGDYFAKIKCNEYDSDVLREKWQELPISEGIKTALDMEQCDGKGCKNVFDKYSIPDIEYGFYYFKDRTPEETDDRKDDTNLNNRSSYNFTVALFDVYKSTIYYYELDT